MKYLGRYLKRPPVSASRLRHYAGGAVVHHYLDHRTGKHKRQTLSQEEMIGRYISHVPARHFKMVRYSGFLANRKRGTLLPKVWEALSMTAREKPKRPGFAVLMKVSWARIHTSASSAKAGCVLPVPWRVSTPQKCSQTGCNRWRKNDGCGCLLWISAPEKQISG